jgi:phosphoglycolate phosphatase
VTPNAICFDLDGTLVDSAAGIEWALRSAAAEVLGDEPLGDIGAVIGGRIDAMLAALLPELDAERTAAIVHSFRRRYDGTGWRRCSTYAGVAETLAALRDDGIALHIVTNKPAAPTFAVLERTGLREYFGHAISPDTPPGSRDKAGALGCLLELTGLVPENVVFVGDTVEDHSASQVNGVPFIGVRYGYGRAGLDAEAARAGASLIDAIHELPARLATTST